MKQNLIYIVLLLAGTYLPTASKECAKVLVVMQPKNETQEIQQGAAISADEILSLPVSLFSSSLVNR